MDPQGWIQLLSIATNLTVILTGVKLIRYVSRIEMKVEMMWGVFIRQFGTRLNDESEKKDE